MRFIVMHETETETETRQVLVQKRGLGLGPKRSETSDADDLALVVVGRTEARISALKNEKLHFTWFTDQSQNRCRPCASLAAYRLETQTTVMSYQWVCFPSGLITGQGAGVAFAPHKSLYHLFQCLGFYTSNVFIPLHFLCTPADNRTWINLEHSPFYLHLDVYRRSRRQDQKKISGDAGSCFYCAFFCIFNYMQQCILTIAMQARTLNQIFEKLLVS